MKAINIDHRRKHQAILPSCLAALGLLTAGSDLVAVRLAGAPIVSDTQHVVLGFTASAPFSTNISDSASIGCNSVFGPPNPVEGASYSLGVSGTASLRIAMGADVTFSYDKATVASDAIMPLNVTYTPTSVDSPNISIHVPLTFTVQGCVLSCVPTVLPPFSEVSICDTVSVPCTLDAGPSDFVAPLTGDSPITVPVSSCTVSLSVAGLDVGSADVTGTITLSPVPAGGLGLGGAVAGFSVSGPASASGLPVLEWDTAGTNVPANLHLNNPLPGAADIKVALKPLVHWLATSADLNVVITLSGTLHDLGIGDPSPITLFNGSLGSIYHDVGLDTEVGNGVIAAIGFDPGFAAAIDAGKIPIPLTDPQLEMLDTTTTTPSLGEVDFTFNTDVTPPTTVAAVNPPPTVFGWNNTSVNVSLTAQDNPGGSGVQSLSFGATGAQPIAATTVLGSSQVLNITTPGVTTISFFATDNQNNVEAVKTVVVRIDEIAPTITITQPAATTYTHSSTLTLNYSVIDTGGSGVDTFTATMDGSPTLAGHGLASGQAISLLTELPLGSHTFAVAATDKAANSSSAALTFEIIVTADSIKQDVTQLLGAGMIKNAGIANSLTAKLNAAAAARAKGNCATAANIYNAFINEVQAQTGKGIDPTAAAILIADAQYLIAHCP